MTNGDIALILALPAFIVSMLVVCAVLLFWLGSNDGR